jgi:putative endonuclease
VAKVAKNERSQVQTARRRKSYRAGLSAELIAGAWLAMKGYRMIARRARTPVGEIDLIVRKGGRISFVEVKFRRSFEAAQASIGSRQRQRVRRAGEMWLARQPVHQGCEVTFDIVMMVPWRMPRHLVNAL